ncbi:hypothetical protein ACOMHN_018929 [Nucella lapillus]
MTSLCPGTLFQAPGLNHHSTPTPPTATPSEIDRKLVRQPFNGQDWPKDSPVARVYDVGNSSTSLVLLNRRRKKKSQLRGLTVRNGEIQNPEPRRHLPEEPSVNWAHHKNCVVSKSAHFRPRVNLDLGWVNTTQRPPVRFDSGSHVNHRRHTSCRVSRDSPIVGWTGLPRRPATTSTSVGVDSELHSMSPLLNDPDIPQGGRKYLYSIARIYSTSQMKQLKQDQYQKLLFRELGKGYHSPKECECYLSYLKHDLSLTHYTKCSTGYHSPKECERYLSYLNTPRKTQYGKLDNYGEMRRSKSVPPPSHTDESGRGEEKDKLGRKNQKRPVYSSRSWAPSLVSSGSRPSTRQRQSKKKSARQQSPLPPSSKPTDETDSKDTRHHSSEPESDEDPTDHTRREESETGDEPLTEIHESEEGSLKSKDKASKSGTTVTQKEAKSTRLPLTTTQDEDGASPRKGDEGTTPRKDVLSPRKGEEPPATPRKDESESVPASEGKDVERSSEGAATSTNIAPNSSNATSNNFLALIVSDAEKDDDSKTMEDSEQEKPSSTDETAPSKPMARKFSDMELASGHRPRMNKEGRTRPLSRAGRGSEQGQEKENSDDDYDDTDDETEKTQTQSTKEKEESPPSQHQQQKEQEEKKEEKEETVQRSNMEREAEAIDTSRTYDSKTEERGEMLEESTTVVHPDKRAGSPEEGRDERAQDSQENEGPRSLIIPVSEQAQDSSAHKADVLDLSSEGKNRDVERLEY